MVMKITTEDWLREQLDLRWRELKISLGDDKLANKRLIQSYASQLQQLAHDLKADHSQKGNIRDFTGNVLFDISEENVAEQKSRLSELDEFVAEVHREFKK